MVTKKYTAGFLSILLVLTSWLNCFPTKGFAQSPLWFDPLVPTARLGQVMDAYRAPNGHKLLIFIEDLHSNQSVQKNIWKLLSWYSEHYPSAAIGVEGASKQLDYSPITEGATASERAGLVRRLAAEGKITGSESYVIDSGQPHRLVGVENERYYQYHLQLFQQSYAARSMLKRTLQRLSVQLQTTARALGRSPADLQLHERLDEASDRLRDLESLLEEQVDWRQASEISRDLPRTLALLRGLITADPSSFELDHPEIENAVQASLDFYAAAALRDRPLAENTLKLLNEGQPTALLVAGGFHVQGITPLLRQAGVSYVVVMPTVTKETPSDAEHYLHQLLGKRGEPGSVTTAGGRNSTLAWIAEILEPEGLDKVRDYYGNVRQNSIPTLLKFRLFPSTRPVVTKWRPTNLTSEESLYAYTVKAVQHRIDLVKEFERRPFFYMDDLAHRVHRSVNGKTETGLSIAQMSGISSLFGVISFNLSMDIPPVDMQFRPSDITADQEKKIAGMLLRGKILHQFFMNEDAETIKEKYDATMSYAGIRVIPEEYLATYFIDIGFLTSRERSSMLGPRQILQLRYTIESIARRYESEFHISPEQAVKNQRLLIHTNEKTDKRIAEDWLIHGMYGYSPEQVVFLPQRYNKPLNYKDAAAFPAMNVASVNLGNGWAQLETSIPGIGYQLVRGRRIYLIDDAFRFFLDRGIRFVHQYRLSDLNNLTTDIVELDSLYHEISAIESGRTSYVVRMASNPLGIKDGIVLRLFDKNIRMICETISMSDAKGEPFLRDRPTQSPIDRFSDTYELEKMRTALLQDGLWPDFEFKHFDIERDPQQRNKILINIHYTTGMLLSIPSLQGLTIYKEGSKVADLNDLPNNEVGKTLWEKQMEQPGFADLAKPYLMPFQPGRREPKIVTYRPWHVALSLLIPVFLAAASVSAMIHATSPGGSVGIMAPTILGLYGFAVGLSKELYIWKHISSQNLQGWSLIKALLRDKPVEELNLTSGEVSGLTGLIPVAHTVRSHALFENELAAHGMDLITIPLEGMHQLISRLLARYFLNTDPRDAQLVDSPLAQAVNNAALAQLLPAGTTVREGRVFLPRPSSFAQRLQLAFHLNPTERKFLEDKRAQLQIQAAA